HVNDMQEANSLGDVCSVKALEWDSFGLSTEGSATSEAGGDASTSAEDEVLTPCSLRGRVDIVVGADLVYWQEPGGSFEVKPKQAL
ncbi:MAG: hypothetical protein AAFN10_15230, partial [Bacteroidota bacterium]